MIFVCVSCGKKFLYRGDPSTAPPCRACGAEIRPEERTALATGAAGPDPRVAELEGQLKSREEELQKVRERLATLEADAQEAGAQIEALQAQLSEAMDRQERVGVEREREIGEARARIAQLEKELQEARTESAGRLQSAVVRSLREKDHELHEAQASIARLGEDLKKAQDAYKEALIRRDREAEEHAAATAEAQASIARLGEDLKKAQDAYKEALQRKDGELAEAHAKIESLERRLSEIAEGGGSEEVPSGAGTGPSTLRAELEERMADLDRAQGRIRQLEKILLDAEQKYTELQKQMEGLQGGASAPETKDVVVARLEAELSARASEAEELRRRLTDLEAIRRREETMAQERGRAEENFRVNVKEAQYLAEDLTRNFESLATTMAGLVERTRRLVECLHQPEPLIPPHVVPGSPAALAETPPGPGMLPPQAVSEPAPVPVLDNLPAPAPGEAAEPLPADDSILEMGKAVGPVETAPPDSETTPATEEAVPESAGDADPVEPPPPTPEPRRPARPSAKPPAPPKKKGLLGRLFGRR